MVHVVFRFCLLYWYSCMLGEENAKSSIEGFGGGDCLDMNMITRHTTVVY